MPGDPRAPGPTTVSRGGGRDEATQMGKRAGLRGETVPQRGHRETASVQNALLPAHMRTGTPSAWMPRPGVWSAGGRRDQRGGAGCGASTAHGAQRRPPESLSDTYILLKEPTQVDFRILSCEFWAPPFCSSLLHSLIDLTQRSGLSKDNNVFMEFLF